MTYSHYERLSAMDALFLELEDHNSHMHIGSVGIFDAKPVTRSDGGLDMERMLSLSDISLQKNPRFRQKIARIPRLERPVWIDDEQVVDQNIAGRKISLRGDTELCKPMGMCSFMTVAEYRNIQLRQFKPIEKSTEKPSVDPATSSETVKQK